MEDTNEDHLVLACISLCENRIPWQTSDSIIRLIIPSRDKEAVAPSKW